MPTSPALPASAAETSAARVAEPLDVAVAAELAALLHLHGELLGDIVQALARSDGAASLGETGERELSGLGPQGGRPDLGLDLGERGQARRAFRNQREDGEAAGDLDRRRGLAGFEREGGRRERRAATDARDDLVDSERRGGDEHHRVVVGQRLELRLGGEPLSGDLRGELRGPGFGLRLGALGGETRAHLRLGLRERLHAGGALLEHLDQMRAEAGADRPDEAPWRGAERRLLELLDHAAAAEEAEIAAAHLRARIVGELGGELGEVLAGLDALAQRDERGVGHLGRPGVVDLEQDVAGANLLFLLPVVEMRVVVGLELGLLEGHLGARAHRVDQQVVHDALRRQAELLGVALEVARHLGAGRASRRAGIRRTAARGSGRRRARPARGRRARRRRR